MTGNAKTRSADRSTGESPDVSLLQSPTSAGIEKNSLRFQPLLIAAAALACGIVVDRYSSFRIELLLAATLIGGMLWIVAAITLRRRLAVLLLIVSIACLGATWHHYRWNSFLESDIGRFAGDEPLPVVIRGTIEQRSHWRPAPQPSPMKINTSGDSTNMMVIVSELRDGDRWRRVSGRLEMRIEGHLVEYRTGESIEAIGLLSKPSKPMNPGEFDSRYQARVKSCLARIRILHPDSIQRLNKHNATVVGQPIQWLRSRLDTLLWTHVDAAQAPLASAVLLGNRDQIDPRERQRFMETGTIHLLAISGLHIGILAMTFLLPGRLGLIPNRWSLIATIVFLFLYAWVVDFRPPVLRASILISMYCFGRLIGREPFSFNSLALAAIVVLALNPTELFAPGGQLSFLAVATIVVCRDHFLSKPSQDPLDKLIAQSRPLHARWLTRCRRSIWNTVLVSLAIWIVTTPLVASRFHIVAPIAIVLNPLLMIPIWFALISGFIVLLSGWMLPPVASVAGDVCNMSLSLIHSSIRAGEPLPGSHWWTSGTSDFWLLIFYGSLALMFVLPLGRIRKRWLVVLLVGWAAVATLFPNLPQDALPARWIRQAVADHTGWQDTSQTTLRVTFINVGHGTSVLIEYPSGTNLLYDGGCIAGPSSATNHISSMLWHRRIERLDAIIISHADADHYNGIPGLLEKFRVDTVFVSPVMFDDAPSPVRFLNSAIEQSPALLRTIRGGQQIDLDSQVTTSILLPNVPEQGAVDVEQSDNSRSVVLAIEYAGHRILLPGDLEGPGMEQLLTTPPFDFDITMSPHHGSATGEHADFAAWSTPEFVVISSGDFEIPQLVSEAYGQAELFNTARDGPIQFEVDHSGIRARRLNAPAN